MQLIENLREFLNGKKSYILGTALFVIGGLKAIGIEVDESVLVILGGLLGVSLRAGINKV